MGPGAPSISATFICLRVGVVCKRLGIIYFSKQNIATSLLILVKQLLSVTIALYSSLDTAMNGFGKIPSETKRVYCNFLPIREIPILNDGCTYLFKAVLCTARS